MFVPHCKQTLDLPELVATGSLHLIIGFNSNPWLAVLLHSNQWEFGQPYKQNGMGRWLCVLLIVLSPLPVRNSLPVR